jgi:hypothetical protein
VAADQHAPAGRAAKGCVGVAYVSRRQTR